MDTMTTNEVVYLGHQIKRDYRSICEAMDSLEENSSPQATKLYAHMIGVRRQIGYAFGLYTSNNDSKAAAAMPSTDDVERSCRQAKQLCEAQSAPSPEQTARLTRVRHLRNAPAEDADDQQAPGRWQRFKTHFNEHHRAEETPLDKFFGPPARPIETR